LFSREIFQENYTKGAILVTIIFCISVSLVTIIHNPFLNSANTVFYYFAGKEILAGYAHEVIVPNAPLTNAMLFALTDNPHFHMRILSIFSTTGIVILSYGITRQIFNAKIAFLTTIFISIYAGLHQHSYQINADVFPIFLLMISFYYITKQKLTHQSIIISAIFIGLSFIVKYQAGIIAVGILMFLLMYTKPRSKNTILFFIVFLIIISPLLVYNYNTAGSFTTSNSSFLILMEWDNVPEEWYEDTSYDTSLLLFRDPGLLVENFSRNIFDSTTQVILNLNDNWNNLSIIPLIPFIGMIPLFGGIYFIRKTIPKNFLPIIITFLIYFPIMCIFAELTNPIRLFPPAIILAIFCAIFFSKINKKSILIPTIVFIICVNLVASNIMANWFLYENDSIFEDNVEFHSQELYNIGQILGKEENIQMKYLMAEHNLVAYYAKSKFIADKTFGEPINLEDHVLRKDWRPYDIFVSDFYSYPQRENNMERMPDYLLIEPQKNIPQNWNILYKSENYVLFKIP
tara:strand:+ start:4523 stop:6070 length:1548 start_codon:yes stop_codon:yes gene_type:complete